MANVDLNKIIEVAAKVSVALPQLQSLYSEVMGLFVDSTPHLSNEERIALLRSAGATVVETADGWLAAHPEG